MTSETREIVHDQHTHPTTKTYVWIGVILAVLTAIEIWLYYLEVGGTVSREFAVPTLIFLSTIKFVLVVMYFMHLKFDSPTFTGVFLFGLALGALAIVGLFVLYHLLPLVYPDPYYPGLLGR